MPWNTPTPCCENCRHWLGSRVNPTIAQVAGEHIHVGQCLGQEESDEAPFADLDNGAEAFVFTPPNGRCKAFSAHQDDDEYPADLCAYNGVQAGHDFPATL